MDSVLPLPEEDLEQFARLAMGAFPMMATDTAAEMQQVLERLQAVRSDTRRGIYGIYRDRQLLGGMILYDFTMNFHSALIPVGGVGMVAVDLLNRREKAARELIAFFLNHFHARGAPIVALYSFRPDFYHQMGFGYGTKMTHYEIRARALPRVPAKQGLRYLTAEDQAEVAALYDRYARNTHGMFLKLDYQLERLLKNPKLLIVGCDQDGRLAGMLAFEFESNKYSLDHKLQVREIVWEDARVLRQLLNFVHTQADQSEWVGIDLTDDSFHYLLSDPRNSTGRFVGMHHESNVQGIGLMYRVIDVPAVLELLAGRGAADDRLSLAVNVSDSFYAPNNGRWVVRIEDGRAKVADAGAADVELRLDVATFSSLAVGAVGFARLHGYGLAELSDPDQLAAVDRFFYAPESPRCLTFF